MSQIQSYGSGGVIPVGVVQWLSDDLGTAIGPDLLGNINIIGGLNINTIGAVNNIIVSLDDNVNLTGNLYAFNITTNTSAATTLTMEDNGLFADGTDANVDISLTTKGTGCVVIDGITGGGLNSTWRTCQAVAQTVGLVTVTMVSIPLAQQEMATVTFTINGYKSTFDQSCSGTVTMSAFRPTGGNITRVGMVQTNFAASAGAGARIEGNVLVGTQSIVLYVTGVAAETWNFVTTYSYMYTTHP